MIFGLIFKNKFSLGSNPGLRDQLWYILSFLILSYCDKTDLVGYNLFRVLSALTIPLYYIYIYMYICIYIYIYIMVLVLLKSSILLIVYILGKNKYHGYITYVGCPENLE